jgi:hypothetical protein
MLAAVCHYNALHFSHRVCNVSCILSNPRIYAAVTSRLFWRYCAKFPTCILCRQISHMHTVPYAPHTYCQVSHMFIVPSAPYAYCAKCPILILCQVPLIQTVSNIPYSYCAKCHICTLGQVSRIYTVPNVPY